jgi:uncharacterized protein (UPF0218 family)
MQYRQCVKTHRALHDHWGSFHEIVCAVNQILTLLQSEKVGDLEQRRIIVHLTQPWVCRVDLKVSRRARFRRGEDRFHQAGASLLQQGAPVRKRRVYLARFGLAVFVGVS